MTDLRRPFTLEIKKKAYTGLETSLKDAWEGEVNTWSKFMRGSGWATRFGSIVCGEVGKKMSM